MNPCPPPERWAQYLDDWLGANDAARLETHLEGCPECVHVLEQLTSCMPEASGDTATSALFRLRQIAPDSELVRLRHLLPAADTVPTTSIGAPGRFPSIAGYAIERELGRGGMGVVYLARQPQLNRRVAIKMILAGTYATQELMVRFFAEAQTCAGLRHPNIVQIYEVGQHAGMPFFSMEYVEGGTLAHQVRGGPLAARPAAAVVEQLARAMHTAHLQGVVHRDLKPANILVAGIGNLEPQAGDRGAGIGSQVKITDFGLARRCDQDGGLTRVGALLGTPAYMAPEQIEPGGGPIGPGVDIYALGAILYQIVTGRPPFDAGSPLETLAQVKNSNPLAPSKLNRAVPDDLSIICLHCLEKQPQRRYATAEALADDLRRFQQGEPIAVHPVTELERMRKWARRNPSTATLSAALIAMVFVALGLVSWQWYLARTARDLETQRADHEASAKLAETRARHEAQLQAAGYALDQGIQECRGGGLDAGLLSMVHALELLPAGESDMEFAIRTNIGAWRERLCPVQRGPGHGTRVVSVAYSPDGTSVLTGNWGNFMGRPSPALAQLWDLQRWDGEPLWTVEHPAAAWSVAFHPRGDRVAVGGFDGTTCVRDARTGKLCFPSLPHPGRVYSVAFSPDGRTLAVGGHASHPTGPITGGGALRFWDAGTGQPLGEPHHLPFRIASVAWSPDGKCIALGGCDPECVDTGTEGVAVLFDFEKRRLHERRMNHGDAVTSLAFHPDGKLLATGCSDGLVRLWSLPDQKMRSRPLRHTYSVCNVSFSHDGKMLATASGHELGIRSGMGEIGIWDVATSTPLLSPHFDPLAAQSQRMEAVAFSGDDRKLVAACAHGRAYLWMLPSPIVPHQAFSLAERAEIDHSPDGRTMLLTVLPPRAVWFAKKPCEVHIIDTSDGRTVKALPHPVCVSTRFSRDGKRFITIPWDPELGPGVWMWDTATGDRLPIPEAFGPALRDVQFTADGASIVTIAANGAFRRWDAVTLAPRDDAMPCLADAERPIAFNENGTRLLASDPTGTRLVSLPDCSTVARLLNEQIEHGGFIDDDSVVVTARVAPTPLVQRFRALDGQRLETPVDANRRHVTVGSTASKRILLDLVRGTTSKVADGTVAARLPLQHEVAMHPTRRFLASTDGGTASHVQLWGIAGKAIGPPLPHGLLYAVDFNPNGQWLVTSSYDRSVKVWPLPAPAEGTPAQLRASLTRP